MTIYLNTLNAILSCCWVFCYIIKFPLLRLIITGLIYDRFLLVEGDCMYDDIY